MQEARIYKPAKSAMQSGKASTTHWILEFFPASAKTLDPLTGWTGSADTRTQLKLKFPDRAAAERYAHEHHIAAVVTEPKPFVPRMKSYADRFSYTKVR